MTNLGKFTTIILIIFAIYIFWLVLGALNNMALIRLENAELKEQVKTCQENNSAFLKAFMGTQK